MGILEELGELWKSVLEVKHSIEMLLKYWNSSYYKEKLRASIAGLNRTYRILKAKFVNIDKQAITEKLRRLDANIETLLTRETTAEIYKKELVVIQDLEIFWPELEVEFRNLALASFDIPEDIPESEHRLDLKEAIKDFDNECYISALVMSRRSYEGALVTLYKLRTGNEPVEKTVCPHCKATIREKSYMGIARLHSWAIGAGLITDKLKQVGFLLTDMGAGAAHPPLTEFPRDETIARLGITTTITLLKEITKIR
jgi:hypothetical protein